MSNTPETDANIDPHLWFVRANFARKLERERDEARRERDEAQARLLGKSAEREDLLRTKIEHFRVAAVELIRLLEIEEESDSGNSFKPNKISSCRVLDGMKLSQCLKKLKELAAEEVGFPKCEHCKEGRVELVRGYEPWSTDYLMCDQCNSTYNVRG